MSNSVESCIEAERTRQDKKWGKRNHSNLEWLSVLAEEFGEIAECTTKLHVSPVHHPNDFIWKRGLEQELIRIAAVCVAWIECIRGGQQHQ